MTTTPVGRFAPSPSGRLHLGNVLCALLSWLSARRGGGKILLRIEDIDTVRCTAQNTAALLDDLRWLGLSFDGGEEPHAYQSHRTAIYADYFERLRRQNRLYPCYCTRAELHAASAPHRSDRQPVYDRRCLRYLHGEQPPPDRTPAWRLQVPDTAVSFTDRLQGPFSENLSRDCGDFLVRRSDGVYAYQLAVVVDDALSGVTEVVRGRDLLSSTPRQIYLYHLFGFPPPQFYHIPLLLRQDGARLAKRDGALDMGALRERFSSPEPLIGMLAYNAGLLPRYEPISAAALIPSFSWDKVPRRDIFLDACSLL